MKLLLSIALVLLPLLQIRGQSEKPQVELYSASYGNNKNPAIVFLHGGPGFNSSTFEFTTAQALADMGFYVIVYDRRGEGRSSDVSLVAYTFEESNTDINNLYKKYGIQKAIVFGHSFGGAVAVMYAAKNPEKVEKLILMGSPVSYPKTLKSISNKCRKEYANKDSEKEYLEMFDQLESDSTSLDYAMYCLKHAVRIKTGFYSPLNPTENGTKLWFRYFGKLANLDNLDGGGQEALEGFYKNEHFTTLDLSLLLNKLNQSLKIYGIYGTEDGLFDTEHLNVLKAIIGSENVFMVENSAHTVYIDQQEAFMNLMIKINSKK